jgi:hypothetical protein
MSAYLTMDPLSAILEQQRACMAFYSADAAGDAKTITHLLGQPYELPITRSSIKTLADRPGREAFPEDSDERRACWRLASEAVEQSGTLLIAYLELFQSPIAVKYIAKKLVRCHVSMMVAGILVDRPDVMRCIAPATLKTANFGAFIVLNDAGYADRLAP